MNWKTPIWYRTSWDAATITDEQIEQWCRETKECDDANKLLYEDFNKMRAELHELLKKMYPGNVTIIKKILRAAIVPSRPSLDFYTVEDRVKKARAAKAQAKQKVIAEKENQELTEQAIIWLQNKGKNQTN